MERICLDISLSYFQKSINEEKAQPGFGKQKLMRWHSQMNERGKKSDPQYSALSASILQTHCVQSMHALANIFLHYILLHQDHRSHEVDLSKKKTNIIDRHMHKRN